MYEVSLEILRVNLEEFKKLRDKDVALTRAKYKKGGNSDSNAEKMAVLGVVMAWEERISDISDAIDLLKGLNEEEFNGPDENRKDDPPKSSTQEQGEAKNEGELHT